MNQSVKKRKRDLIVHVLILQNGIKLDERNFPTRRDWLIVFSSKSSGRSKIWLPCYQFYGDELDIIYIRKGKVHIKTPLGCHGVGTSKGEFIKFQERYTEESLVELEQDDYISVGYKDLRILIKVHRSLAKAVATEAKSPGYISPFLNFVFSEPAEKLALSMSFLFAFILVGAICGGLILNNYERPQNINGIPEEYVLPFISQRYIQAAPELLKEKLNVLHMARSVVGYNASSVELLMGENSSLAEKYLDSITTESYKRIFKNQAMEIVHALEIQNSVDLFQRKTEGARTLVVPTIKTETLNGTINRVLDKVDLILQGAEESILFRRKTTESFKTDSPHIYEEYQNIEDKSARSEALKQIKPWAQLTTEEQLYKKVEQLSKKGALGPDSKNKSLDLINPIGIHIGSKYLTVNVADLRLFDKSLDDQVFGVPFSIAHPKPKSAPKKSEFPDSSDIENFIKIHKYQLQICYEIALRGDNLSQGTMEWKWKIDSQGKIFDVVLVTSNINNERMTRCIREKIRQWQFPPTKNGVIEISFPFEFSPTKG